MVVSDINVTLSIALNLSTVFFAHSLPFLPSILTVSEFKRPPIKKSSSAKITFAPELAAESAADKPEAPAPMIRMSQYLKPLS